LRELGFEFGFELYRGERPRGFAQAFDVVEGALFREEDVDDDVDVVEEDPFGLATAFDGGGVETEFLLEAHLDLVGDGDDLTIVGGGGDEEEVGETGVCGIEFEDASVFAFFVFASCNSSQELAAGFRSCHRVSDSPCTSEEARTMLAGRYLNDRE